MKLTREDLEIWVGQVMVLRSEFGNSWALCMYQDRRDADLMLAAQQNRSAPMICWTEYTGTGECGIAIPVRGAVNLGYFA